MRHVFTSSQEVCHQWANQMNVEPHGRYARCANVYFHFWQPECIFSYGNHYCLGRMLSDNVVLLNTTRYSATTSKHQYEVRSATSHFKQVFCPDPRSTRYSMEGWRDQIDSLLKKLCAARNPEMYLEQLAQVMNDIAIYRKYVPFKLKEYKWYQSAVLSRNIEKHWTKLSKEFMGEIAEEREQKRMKNPAWINRNWGDIIRKWEAGEKKNLHDFNVYNFGYWGKRDLTETARKAMEYCYIREKGEKGRLETSKGVVIPRAVAQEFGKRLKDGLVRIGDRVMNFTVRELSDEEISIGCHTFSISYLMKWYDKIAVA